MNANEIADWVEQQSSFGWSGDFGKFLIEIAAMLRQQQAEIEALKQIIDANNLNQNIGQFVKAANEPVAWISRLPEGDVYNCAWAEKQNDDDIPLYTHPVKELTDEEILDLCPPNHSDMMNEAYTIEFARAILRKAQEK